MTAEEQGTEISSEQRGKGGPAFGGNRLERISRKLSHVLRHDDMVAVRPDGYCIVQDLLQLKCFTALQATLEDLKLIVAGTPESGNSKQRFQFTEEEGWGPLIRATQGYSRRDIKAEHAYRRLEASEPELPQPCVHGTYCRFWDSIRRLGLIPGGLPGSNRNHRYVRSEVHFACEDPGPDAKRAISGMRANCNLVIYLDLRRALEDGLPFFLSKNGVILSPGGQQGNIPASYFLQVWDYSTSTPTLLWKDGSPAPGMEDNSEMEDIPLSQPRQPPIPPPPQQPRQPPTPPPPQLLGPQPPPQPPPPALLHANQPPLQPPLPAEPPWRRGDVPGMDDSDLLTMPPWRQAPQQLLELGLQSQLSEQGVPGQALPAGLDAVTPPSNREAAPDHAPLSRPPGLWEPQGQPPPNPWLAQAPQGEQPPPNPWLAQTTQGQQPAPNPLLAETTQGQQPPPNPWLAQTAQGQQPPPNPWLSQTPPSIEGQTAPVETNPALSQEPQGNELCNRAAPTPRGTAAEVLLQEDGCESQGSNPSCSSRSGLWLPMPKLQAAEAQLGPVSLTPPEPESPSQEMEWGSQPDASQTLPLEVSPYDPYEPLDPTPPSPSLIQTATDSKAVPEEPLPDAAESLPAVPELAPEVPLAAEAVQAPEETQGAASSASGGEDWKVDLERRRSALQLRLAELKTQIEAKAAQEKAASEEARPSVAADVPEPPPRPKAAPQKLWQQAPEAEQQPDACRSPPKRRWRKARSPTKVESPKKRPCPPEPLERKRPCLEEPVSPLSEVQEEEPQERKRPWREQGSQEEAGDARTKAMPTPPGKPSCQAAQPSRLVAPTSGPRPPPYPPNTASLLEARQEQAVEFVVQPPKTKARPCQTKAMPQPPPTAPAVQSPSRLLVMGEELSPSRIPARVTAAESPGRIPARAADSPGKIPARAVAAESPGRIPARVECSPGSMMRSLETGHFPDCIAVPRSKSSAPCRMNVIEPTAAPGACQSPTKVRRTEMPSPPLTPPSRRLLMAQERSPTQRATPSQSPAVKALPAAMSASPSSPDVPGKISPRPGKISPRPGIISPRAKESPKAKAGKAYEASPKAKTMPRMRGTAAKLPEAVDRALPTPVRAEQQLPLQGLLENQRGRSIDRDPALRETAALAEYMAGQTVA